MRRNYRLTDLLDIDPLVTFAFYATVAGICVALFLVAFTLSVVFPRAKWSLFNA